MKPNAIEVFAPAKINLTLHVTGQRNDGYHLLDSLVAFATIGDVVTISEGDALTLAVDGPENDGLPDDMQNLAMRAAALVRQDGAALTLTKNLPASSGIGGGAADAAAAYRGMLYHTDRTCRELSSASKRVVGHHAEKLLALGADIPMCLLSRSARVTGIGEHIEPLSLPYVPAVLVNSRLPVATPDVFRALTHRQNASMPDELPVFQDVERLIGWLAGMRNDLEAAALKVAPVIGDVLGALKTFGGCKLARMSGSGATCFGLFTTPEAASDVALELGAAHPDWWVKETVVGEQSALATPQADIPD